MLNIFYRCCLLLLLTPVIRSANAQWVATFTPNDVIITMEGQERIQLQLSGLSEHTLPRINDRNYVRLRSENERVATIEDGYTFTEEVPTNYTTTFAVNGAFVGLTRIIVEIRNEANVVETSQASLAVGVLRPERLMDTLFSVVIILLLAILFVNFGAAISLKVILKIFKRPIGVTVGSVCQIIFLPLIGYGLGVWLFADEPELALGLFLTAISPAGGASNVFTLLLDGNINLSISMTTISTLACFGTMPLWLFLLGQSIFERANLGIPYLRVMIIALSLFIPLCIGVFIQIMWPRIAKFLVRILKPMSLIFIILVILFGIVTNWYMLELFAWQIAVAGLGLPWLGFIVGWTAAKLFCQTKEDTIAIYVEVGLQNTGLTMFIMTFSLDQPAADITMIIPIAVSVMSPLPLIAIMLIKKCWNCRKPKKVDEDSIEKAPQEALEEDLKANGPSTSENSLAESDRTTDTHL